MIITTGGTSMGEADLLKVGFDNESYNCKLNPALHSL